MPDLLHPIKQKLLTALSHGLPGTLAHKKMAVPGRELLLPDHNNAKKAAVLILFYHRLDHIFIAFIKRKTHEADHHSGQISFPGGKMEANDNYPVDTALREAMEEIGTSDKIDILGHLSPLYIPVSNFYVAPVVGWHRDPFPNFNIQESEVDELLEIDLDLLLNPGAKTHKTIKVLSSVFLKEVPAYEIHGHIIWGATAMMLSELEWVLGQS